MDNTYAIIDGELYHWGIRGMKWGRRRYQNKDGSLTPEGRKRYADDGDGKKGEGETEPKKTIKTMSDDEVNKAIARSQLEERYNSQVRNKDANEGSYRTKSVKDMNDEELVRAIERSRLETTYKQLNPEPVNAGKEFAKKVVNEAVVPALISSGKNFLEKTLNKFTEKYIGVEVDELAKLKRELDIEETKKKIKDIKNPKEDIDETIKKLKQKQELDSLTDEELQKLKKDAEKSKLNKTIREGVDPDDDDGNSGGNNKPKKDKPKKDNKPKNDVDDSDDGDEDDSSDTMSRADKKALKAQAKAEAKAEKEAEREERNARLAAKEEADEAEFNRLKESTRLHNENAKRIQNELRSRQLAEESEEIDRRLEDLRNDVDDNSYNTIRVSTTAKIGEDFVSNLLSRASASNERLAQKRLERTINVSKLKALLNNGTPVSEVSARYGIPESTLYDIKNS
jgi:hypothetical protein